MRPYLCSPFASRLLGTRTVCAHTWRAFCFSLSALLLMVSLLSPALPVQASAAPSAAADPTGPTGPQAPVFVPNGGQTDSRVRFESYALGGTVFFTQQEVVLALPDAPVTQAKPSNLNSASAGASAAADAQERVSRSMQVARVKFEGANSSAVISAEDEVPGVMNIMLGSDPSKWQMGLKNYGSIVYKDLYKGVNLRYEGQANALKGTYEVAAGADPSQIRWSYKGAADVQVDPTSGDLKISLVGGKGQLVERAPQAWQEIDGKRVPVSASYAVNGSKGSSTVGFTLGSYDKSQPLTIDPTLEYSTYLGGLGADRINAMSLNANGDVFVTGETYSVLFPDWSGSLAENSYPNVFVAGMHSDGTKIYRTVFGGDNTDQTTGLVVKDTVGGTVVHLSGYTLSSDFPLKNQFAESTDRHGNTDMFVASLNESGAISFSSQMGGPGPDQATALALQGSTLYVTGYTDMYIDSTKCPSDADCSPHAGSDIVLAKLDLSGATPVLVFIKQFGGGYDDQARAIAVDSAGAVYITGSTTSSGVKSALFPLVSANQTIFGGGGDAFLTKMDSSGTMVYSSFLGGTNTDEGRSILFDAANNTVYITGRTLSTGYAPLSGTKSSSWDAFVMKVPTGTWTPTGVYLGGNGQDQGNAIALASDGTIYVAGTTSSTDFPLINPLSGVTGGLNDAFLIRYTPSFDKVYSTELGGSGDDYGQALALYQPGADPTSMVMYIAGYTNSADFPTTSVLGTTSQTKIGGGDDGFIARIGNSRPVVDLNGAGVGIDNTASFIETGGAVGSGPVSLGASATVTDSDNEKLAYLEARFVASKETSGTAIQPPDGAAETLSVTLTGGMTGSYNATTGVLRLTSGASTTIADFQTALQSLQYNNTSDTPTTTDRLVAIEASDGMNINEPLAFVTISVAASNDKPVLSAPATISGFEDQANALNGFTVSDPDAGTNPVKLSFSVPAGILTATVSDPVSASGSGTSTLVLTGPMANLNTLLAVGSSAVTYTGATDYNGNVTLTVTLDDQGYSPSGALTDTKTVTLTLGGVNDAPVLSAPPTITGLKEDVAGAINGFTVADIDAGTNPVKLTFSVPEGVLNATVSAPVTASGSGTSTLVLTGSMADLNTLLGVGSSAVTYQGAKDYNGNVTLTVTLDDQGYSPSGPLTDTRTVTLTLDGVNDAPVLTVPASLPNLKEDQANPLSGFAITDVDAGSGTILLTFSVPAAQGTLSATVATPVTADTSTAGGVTTLTLTGPLSSLNTLLGNNAVKFTGAPDYNVNMGNVTLTVTVDDQGNSPSGALTDTETLTFSLLAVNDPPTFTPPAAALTVTTTEDNSYTNQPWVTLTTPGVFVPGPTDESGQTVAGFVISNISNPGLFTDPASLQVNQNGQMSFSLKADANGETTFDVQLVDSGSTEGTTPPSNLSNKVQVKLIVTPVNDKPALTVPVSPVTGLKEDLANVLSGFSVYDVDQELAGDFKMQLTFSVPAGTLGTTYTGTSVTVGNTPLTTLVLTGPISELNTLLSAGQVTYTGASNYNGNVLLTVTLDDLGNSPSGALTDTKTVTLTLDSINDAPVLSAPAAINGLVEDVAGVISGEFSISDVDAGTNPVTLTFSAPAGTLTATVASPVTASGNGTSTLTLTGPIADLNTLIGAGSNAVTYKGAQDVNGTVTLTVTVNDQGYSPSGALSDSENVTLTLNAVNDAPVLTVPASLPTLKEDQANNLSGFAISDVDAGSGTILLTFSASTGTLSVPADSPVTINGNGTSTLELTGPLSSLNTLLGNNAVKFTGAPDYNVNIGNVTLTVTVDDQGNSPSGALTDTETLTFSLLAVNDPPTFTPPAAALTVTTTEDNSYTNQPWVTLTTPGVFVPGPTDESGQTVAGFVISNISNPGLFTDPASLQVNQNGQMSFSLKADANGETTFDVQLVDSGSTEGTTPASNLSNKVQVKLIVTPVNDKPVITAPATVNVTEDLANPLPGFSVSDVDAAYAVDLSYDFDMQLSFSVPAGEGTLGATVPASITMSGSGTNSLTLTGKLSALKTLLASNAVAYTPVANFSGDVTLTVNLSDLGNTPGLLADALTDTKTVTLTVGGVNDPPVLTAPPTITGLKEDKVNTLSGFAVADPDAGTNPVKLTFSITTGTLNAVVSSPVTASGSGTGTVVLTGPMAELNTQLSAGAVTYTGAKDDYGDMYLMVTLDDQGYSPSGALTDQKLVTLKLDAVNDPPSFDAPATVEVYENSGSYSAQWATNIKVGPANESTQTLSDFVVTVLSGASLFSAGPTVTADGILQFTPATDAHGTATMTVSVQDSGPTGTDPTESNTYQMTLTINVTTINDLSLSVTANEPAKQVLPGFGTTFTLTASNPNVTAANHVKFTTTLPALLSFDAAASSGCDAAGQVVTCTVTSVAAKSTASVTLGVRVSVGLGVDQALTFTVNLTADEHDPDTSNNQASGTVNAVYKLPFYFNDFETAAGSEWSAETRSQTPLQKRNFLGEFNNQSITLTFPNLPDHGQVEVDFDLFILRSWDGNQSTKWTQTNSIVPELSQTPENPGPDLWEFAVDNDTLIHSSFTNWEPMRQSYPAWHEADNACFTGASESKTLGYSYGYFENLDSVYHIHKVIDHTSNTLTLTFQDLGLQGMLPEGYFDESWGLDNVKVQLLGEPLPFQIFMPMLTKK